MTKPDVQVGRVSLDAIDYHRHNVRTDLGDLRDLTASIRQFGVMQPVVLERRGDRLRIRAGHRRVAAARLAGLERIPALIHGDALEDDEWLTAAVHENTRRRGLDDNDRARAARAMRAEGMTWRAIGEAFGVSDMTARRYAGVDESEGTERPAARPAGAPAERGHRPIRVTTIRSFAQEAQVRVDAGDWSAQDVLTAVLRLADEGSLAAALNTAVPA